MWRHLFDSPVSLNVQFKAIGPKQRRKREGRKEEGRKEGREGGEGKERRKCIVSCPGPWEFHGGNKWLATECVRCSGVRLPPPMCLRSQQVGRDPQSLKQPARGSGSEASIPALSSPGEARPSPLQGEADGSLCALAHTQDQRNHPKKRIKTNCSRLPGQVVDKCASLWVWKPERDRD